MIAKRIKSLREQQKLTQSDLAKKLGITRSSVNAWEQGISVPSTECIVELAKLFKVSTDYLLGVDSSSTIKLDNLTDEDIIVVHKLVNHLRKMHNK